MHVVGDELSSRALKIMPTNVTVPAPAAGGIQPNDTVLVAFSSASTCVNAGMPPVQFSRRKVAGGVAHVPLFTCSNKPLKFGPAHEQRQR